MHLAMLTHRRPTIDQHTSIGALAVEWRRGLAGVLGCPADDGVVADVRITLNGAGSDEDGGALDARTNLNDDLSARVVNDCHQASSFSTMSSSSERGPSESASNSYILEAVILSSGK